MKAPHACLTGTATAQVADVVASSIEGDSDTFAANKLIDGDWDTRWSSDQSTNAQTVGPGSIWSGVSVSVLGSNANSWQ